MTHIPLSYDTLRLIWWMLLGILLIGFAIMDGYDLGVGMLLPFAARTDPERRQLINLIGPTWEGNQVWLVLGGGAIFAAWPALYAASFSGFYLAMVAVLVALILRPVGFKFRGKIHDARWTSVWDWALFVGGFVPALIFGVAVGNVLVGAPVSFDDTMRTSYHGSFFGLLMPFPLLAGLVSVAMLATHGAVMIAGRCPGEAAVRARAYGRIAALATFGLFALAGLWIAFGVDGYRITSVRVIDGPSDPLSKTVVTATGAWLDNFTVRPITILAPLLGLAGPLVAGFGLGSGRPKTALFGSSIGIFGIVATAGVALFPFLMPSTIDPAMSLTVWDASSSQLTLFIMLIAAVVFLPLVLAYTSWAYWIMRGPVSAETIARNPNAY